MNATKTPIHPDAAEVPSVMHETAAGKWAPVVDEARTLVRASVAEQNLPGLSIAVGARGDIVWAEGFGWANLTAKEPVVAGTQFRSGEISKALTSAAVGLLLEKGRLNLDDEVQKYVPDFPRKEWPVTVRQLMAHVGGLRDDAGDEAAMDTCTRTLDGLKMFADEPLRFEPGTEYRPSSFSWTLVSAAVESAAGEPFFDFMRAQVFAPAGMTQTRPDILADAIPNRATFYFPKFAGDPVYGPDPARAGDHSCYAGGGAFLSTPSDLVRYGMAITSGTLLKPETVQTLQTVQRLSNGEETGYGLGWKIETVTLAGQPARMAGHGVKGDFIGGTAYLMTFPDRGLVVAVMTNISFADAKSIALKVAEAFARQAS